MSEIDRFKKDLDIEDEGAINGVSHSVPTGMASPIGQQASQFGFPVTNGVSHAERCDECGQWFAGIGQLIKHANRHHSGAGIRSKPYSCKQCNKSFANASYLSQHNRIHQGVRPYKCEECTKTFTQLSHLQQHKRTHTGEKPYKCKSPGCTKAFSQLSNLQSHTRSHMTDKPFHCNSCYKCFSQQAELDQHRLEHGRSRLLRTHVCKFCGKGYVQIAYLEKHIAKHESEEHSSSGGGPGSGNGPVSSQQTHHSRRPGSSLSSTPTTTTSVVPGLQESNSGTTPQQQQLQQAYNTNNANTGGSASGNVGSSANNANFYNAASPIGLPPIAQDMDRLPQQHNGSSPHQPDFFGAAPFNVVPPNVTLSGQTSSNTNTLPSFTIPPLNMLNMLPVLSGANSFDQWQANHQAAVASSTVGGGYGNWSTYNGPM